MPNILISPHPNVVLGVNPPPGSVGALYTDTFDFPPIYPPRIDLPSATSDSSTDYTARYRASVHNILPSMRDSGPMTARPGMYPLPPANSWPSWDQGSTQDSQDTSFSNFDHKSGGPVLVFTPTASSLTDLPPNRWFWPQSDHSILPHGYTPTSSPVARLQWKRQQYFSLRDLLCLVDLCSFVIRSLATQSSSCWSYASSWIFPGILGNYPLLVVERPAYSKTTDAKFIFQFTVASDPDQLCIPRASRHSSRHVTNVTNFRRRPSPHPAVTVSTTPPHRGQFLLRLW